MLLFIELFTLACFLLCAAHAAACRGREGIWLFAALAALGFVRENFVALYKLLYEFAPLTLQLGAAPVIGCIIWAYSIYVTVVWAEGLTGRNLDETPASPLFLLLACGFMAALAGFYEPILARIGMARWEEGTWMAGGVPLIALIGYPTLTLLFLLAWGWIGGRRLHGGRRAAALAAVLLPISLLHAAGLQALKSRLGW